MKGLIQMAVPVISSWKEKQKIVFINFLVESDMWRSSSKKELTSERSKLPFVHNIIERTESAVFRIAYWRAPSFSQNIIRLDDPKERLTLEMCAIT